MAQRLSAPPRLEPQWFRHRRGAEMWFDTASNEGVILVSNRSLDGEERLVSDLFREADGY